MNKPINLQYIPTREDYFHTALLFYWNLRLTWALLIIFGAMFLLGVAGIIWLQALLASILSMLLLPTFLALLALSQVQVMRSVDHNERMRAETTWEVTPEGILTRNRFGESRCDWGTFGQMLENGRYFLFLYSTNPRMFQFVPKRAFRSPEDLQAFQRMAQEGMQRAVEMEQAGEASPAT